MKYFQKQLSMALAAPLMLCAGGALAQDAAPGVGACGQPAALNSQPMVLNAKPTELSGGLVELRRNEPRYVELTIGAEMPLAIATMTSERDMTLILFDSKGEVVGSDDDSGADSNAQLIAMLAPGVYCAQIAAYGGIDALTLVVPFSISAAPPADACIRNAAAPVELRNDSDEIISTGVLGDPVNFAFRLAEGTGLSIAARSPMFDTILTLQDEYGREVATDDDGGGDTNSLLELSPGSAAKDYCVTLSSLDDDRGIYSLALTPAASGAAMHAPPQTVEDAVSAADAAVAAVEEAAREAEQAAADAASAAAAAAQEAADAAAGAGEMTDAPAQ